MGIKLDLVGRVFGRLTVNSYKGVNKNKTGLWGCTCSCGNTTVVYTSSLNSGKTKSCGCLIREAITTHGMSRTPTYNSYRTMLERCTDERHPHYYRYGGRGITIYESWLKSPRNFLKDMGERPEGMTLDRIDNDGNYVPSNCRWVTVAEQAQNTKSNKLNRRKVQSIHTFNRWGLSSRLIGKVLGAAPRTIRDVINKKTWKNIPEKIVTD